MKYPKWQGAENEGRVEALLNIVGEPNAEGLLSGELDVEFKPSQRILFDRNGRRIPPRGLRTSVCDPNLSFTLEQPIVNFGQVLARLQDSFPEGTKFVVAGEFEERIRALLARVQQDAGLVNAFKGPHCPICLPQMELPDLGQFVEMCAEAAGRSYEQQFPGRKFHNQRRGTLQSQVTIAHKSHKQLLEKLALGPLCGILTVPLQGYSVFAQREQMTGLPDVVALAGLELAVAMAGYPETLARSFNTPGLDLSAYQWQFSRYSLSFGAYGDRLVFDFEALLGNAYGHYSGGLFFLG